MAAPPAVSERIRDRPIAGQSARTVMLPPRLAAFLAYAEGTDVATRALPGNRAADRHPAICTGRRGQTSPGGLDADAAADRARILEAGADGAVQVDVRRDAQRALHRDGLLVVE